MAGFIQDSGFEFWLGCLGQIIIFFKLKQRYFSKKKKNQRVATGLTGLPGHTEFFLPLFFFQSGSVPSPSLSTELGRVLKLYVLRSLFYYNSY